VHVRNCLRDIDAPGKRSFWGIRNCLPKETREYVPKVLAVAVIGADPKLFGFDLPGEEEMMDRFDVVEVPEVTSVARLAELAGVSDASLRRDNTELDSPYTPGRHFPLYVPKGRGALVIAGLAVEERRPSVAPLGSLETGRP
jgi:membrane-bound lytic murein transglycosylase D